MFTSRAFTGQIVSALGHWRRRALVAGAAAVAVVASGVVVAIGSTPAVADTVCGYQTEGTTLLSQCGTTPPLLYLQGMFAANADETAALQELEDQAVAQTISDHHLAASDRVAVLTWGRDVAEAELWSLLVQAVQANPRTTTQQQAVNWLQNVERQYGVDVAYEAGSQYAQWSGIGAAQYQATYNSGNVTEAQLEALLSTTPEPYTNGGSSDNPGPSGNEGYCVFVPPSPYEGDYTSDYYSPTPPQTCFVPCALCNPPTPSYDDFAKWGAAVVSGGLFSSTDFAILSRDIVQLATLGGATAVGAGVGAAISASTGSLFAGSVMQQALFPFAGRALSQAAAGGLEAVTTAAEAAEVGGALTASGVGAIVGIAIAAVTTAVLEGLDVINAAQLPAKLATLITSAPNANPDVNAILSDSTQAQSLYSLFVLATMHVPPLVQGQPNQDKPTSPDITVCDGTQGTVGSPVPCDAPEVPAALAGDPLFSVTPDGSTPTTQSSITWVDGTGGTTNTDSARMSGNWFVEQVTPSGGAPVTVQTLRIHYLDWAGVEQNAWVTSSTDPTTGNTLHGFEGMPDAWQNPATPFNPATCESDGTCWTASSIQYVGPDGTHYSAAIPATLPETPPQINSISYDPTPAMGPAIDLSNPTVGFQTTYSADASSPVGLPLTYTWLFTPIYPPAFSCLPKAGGGCVNPSIVLHGSTASYSWPANLVPPAPFTVIGELDVTDSAGHTTSTFFQQTVRQGPTITLQPVCDLDYRVPPCDDHLRDVGDGTVLTGSIQLAGPDDAGDTASVDWGDGTTSPITLPVHGLYVSHAYTATGLFPVTLTVTDANGYPVAQVTTTETVDGGPHSIDLYDFDVLLPDGNEQVTYGAHPIVTAIGAVADPEPITLTVVTPNVCALNGPVSLLSGTRQEVTFATLDRLDVGVCDVAVSQPGDDFWSGVNKGVAVTVSPASLTITPQAATMNYGHAAPTVSATYAGFLNGDTSAVVTGLSCVGTDTDGNPVGPTTPPGTYPISCSGATAANYTITYSLGAQLTVGPPLVAPAVTSAASTTFAVGAAHAFTVTTKGDPVPSLSVTGTLPAGLTFVDNGDGTATLSGTADAGSEGAYPVTVSATNGLQTATQTLVVTVTGGSASPTTGVLTGDVTDSGGAPVPNACVYLYTSGSSSSAAYGTCARPNGSWEIDGVAAGSYNVAFVDPSAAHATQWYTGDAGGAPDQADAATLTVTAGQTIAGLDAVLADVSTGNIKGTVTEATSGTPLANVCVYLYQHGNSAAASYATCTASNGTYEIGGVATGAYDVAFVDPSAAHVAQWHTGADGGAPDQAGAVAVTVPAGDATLSGIDAAMALTPSGNVSGTVTAAGSGTPLANICVYLYPHGNSTAASYATCTGSDGSYRLRDVAAGSYDVAFYDPAGDDATQWYTGSAGGAANQAAAVALTVSGGNHTVSGVNAAMAQVQQGKVAGVVTASDTGDPLASVCVYLYPHGNSTAASYATCTGSDGSYELSGVATGSYDVAFADPSSAYVTQWYSGSAGGATDQASAHAVSVPAGNQKVSDIDAALSPVGYGNVSGSVTDATSAPLANVCVYLYPHGNSTAASYATCTGGDGSYRIPNVAPGFYDVAFYDPSGGHVTQWYTGSAGGSSDQADASPISVTDGNRTVSDIDATMAQVQSGNITGSVTAAATGDPLANVCVYLYKAGTSSSAAYATCTQADGTYVIYGLAPGSYDVAFYDPTSAYETQWYDGNAGGAPDQADATEVTVPAGNQTVSGIDAALAAPVA